MNRGTEWRRKNPEKSKAWSRAYYHKNRAKKLTEHARWNEQHYEWTMWNMAKQRSKREGKEFTISKEDVIIPTLCPYLQCVLTTVRGKGRVWSNASLDRIDNTKGYIKGNIQVISDLANCMKRSATIEQLLTFAKNILLRHGH